MIHKLMQRRGACLSSTVHKKSLYWFTFSTGENSKKLEGSAINDGQSMLAMLLTVLYMLEGIETETWKYDYTFHTVQ